ncbi:MAG TPA: hypothetical protein VN922_15905 [Bacteroidia bacterium]|nr:hypothetical protein [Bacteroidia bacterium]
MKTDYANNDCEKRVHELLAPLTGVCPDSVWESVSIDLDTKRAEAKNKWTNKISNAPRLPLMVAGTILVITISAWMFFTHKNIMPKNEIVNSAPVKHSVSPAPKPEVNIVPVAQVTAPKTVNVQPSQVTDQGLNQQQNMAAIKIDKHKKLIDSTTGKPYQPIELVKQDNSPILIHTDNELITSTDERVNKGVAINLNRKDTASSMRSMVSQTQSISAADSTQ